MKTMPVALAAAVLGASLGAQPPKGVPADRPAARNEPLRRELLDMDTADQAARTAMLKVFGEKGIALTPGKPITDPRALAVMAEEGQKLAKVDDAHRARLKAIVDAHGWPGKSLVGADGAHAAWLLVQHADADPAFQQKCLRLMEAAPAGEVAGKDIAYLTDRVLIGQRKPQRYGTQLGPDFKPLPVEDETQVDARRAKLGLPSLAAYQKAAKAEYDKLLGKPQDKK